VIPLLSAVFVASLLGSAHCAAMCGGFACVFAGGAKDARARLAAHAAYHGGRLLAYAALGAAAGLLGAAVDKLGAWAGIERGASIVAGALMVLWGAAALRKAWSGARSGAGRRARAGATARRSAPVVVAAPAALLRAGFGRVRDWPPASRALAIGLLSALLPCGWLFAFVTTAAGTAHALSGALAMAAFWAGTVPLLAGVGVAIQSASGVFARRLPVVTSIALVVVGLLTVAGKWTPGRHAHASSATSEASANHAGH
jgi:sulfite exporter TauE/SafE